MKLPTSRFGELDIEPSEEITFPRGLLGFPGRTRFLLLPAEQGEDPQSSRASRPFWWLQSTEDGDLAFVVTDPHLHVPAFRVPLGRAQLAAIGLEGGAAAATAVQVLVIVNKRGHTLTGNLQGPLLVNTVTRVGEQFVLSDKSYGTNVPLLNLKAADPGAVVSKIGAPAALSA